MGPAGDQIGLHMRGGVVDRDRSRCDRQVGDRADPSDRDTADGEAAAGQFGEHRPGAVIDMHGGGLGVGQGYGAGVTDGNGGNERAMRHQIGRSGLQIGLYGRGRIDNSHARGRDAQVGDKPHIRRRDVGYDQRAAGE